MQGLDVVRPAIPGIPQSQKTGIPLSGTELEELAFSNQVESSLRFNRGKNDFVPYAIGSRVWVATPQHSGFKLPPGQLYWGGAAEIVHYNDKNYTYRLRWITDGVQGEPRATLSQHWWGHADLKPVPATMSDDVLREEATLRLGYEAPTHTVDTVCAFRKDTGAFLVTYRGLPPSACAWVSRDQIGDLVDLDSPSIATCAGPDEATQMQMAVSKSAKKGQSKSLAGGKRRHVSSEGRLLTEGKRYKPEELARGSVVNTRRRPR